MVKEVFVQKCCFTGYRPQKLPFEINNCDTSEYKKFENSVLEELLKVCDLGVDTFYTGMAMGFDIFAAELVLTIKNAYKKPLKLVCVMPFKDQDKSYPIEWKTRFDNVLENCDERIVLDEEYNRASYQKRNIFMVDNTDCVLTWYDGKSGGTRNTIDYALKKGRYIFNAYKESLDTIGFQEKIEI